MRHSIGGASAGPTQRCAKVPRVPASYRTIVRVVVVVVLTAFLLLLLWQLRGPISWIVIAVFIAVALAGPVNLLSRRMRRGWAILICYAALVLLPVAIGSLMIPPLVSGVNDLAQDLPGYVADVQDFVSENERLRELERDYQVLDRLREQAAELPQRLGGAAQTLGNLGLGLVNSVFALVTILIMSVFLVSSGPGWIKALIRLQSPARADRLQRTLYRIGDAIGNYVGGALVQATIAGVLSYIVLVILGVPFAGPLALLIALLDLIPLIGATIGAVIVGLVTVFNDFPADTIIWVVWSIIYQQLENTVIQPQIQKRAVQVHPFVVLVAVLFGSTLFGVGGALLAIPIAASIQIVIREWWLWRHEQRELDQPMPVTMPVPPPPPV